MSRPGGNLEVDRVREATDIVALVGEHVRLERKGREHVGLCPFHDDRSPSMHVVSHKGSGFYKCFACGASGDCFTFVQEYHRVGFGEALQMLADRAGIPLAPRGGRREGSEGPSRAEMLDACTFAHRLFRAVLQHPEHGATGREVIERRGISPEMVETFGIGYAPPGFETLRRRVEADGRSLAAAIAAGLLKRRDGGGSYDAFRNRLMFPICDDMGRAIAFGARAIDPEDSPKYLNSADSRIFDKSRTLYGLHLARPAIVESGATIVTEGYTDVIACHQAGVRNVVGTMGTALTEAHAERLARHADTAILVFDGDEAGQRAADRAVRVFFRSRIDVKVCVLPEGQDPDEIIASRGAEGFRALIDAASDALGWKLDRFRASLGPASGVSAREAALEAFLAELAELGFAGMSPVRRQLVLGQLQGLLHVPAADLAARLAGLERDADLRRRRLAARPPTPAASSSATRPSGPTPAGGPPVARPPAAAATAASGPTDDEGRPLVAPDDVDVVMDPDVFEDQLRAIPTPAAAGTSRPAMPGRSAPGAPAAPPPLDRARRAAERELAALALEDPASLRSVAAAVDADPAWTARLAGVRAAAGAVGADGAPEADASADGPQPSAHRPPAPHAAAPLATFLAPPETADAGPGTFLDPPSRAVAAALGRWLAGPSDEDPPGAGAIMDMVTDESTRAVVASLHFDGEKLASAAPEPGPPAILAALEALIGMLERQRSDHVVRRARMDAAAGSMSGDDLVALLEVRRREGNRPAAIARRPAELTPRRSGRGWRPGPGPGSSSSGFSGPRRPS